MVRPPVPQIQRRELTGVDITVGEFQVGAATSFVKRPGKPARALKWWRAVALSSLAATAFAAVLLLGFWRRAPEPEARPAPRPAGAATPSTWWTVPVGRNTAAKPAPRRAPASRAVVAADSAPDDTEHRRRHRRLPSADEDATLPPSDVDSEP